MRVFGAQSPCAVRAFREYGESVRALERDGVRFDDGVSNI